MPRSETVMVMHTTDSTAYITVHLPLPENILKVRFHSEVVGETHPINLEAFKGTSSTK